MPFNIDERVKISTKVLAAGVIDGFEDAQWYETRFPNSFSSLASDVYGLSATTGFGYVTANPAANLAAAQAAAAANPAVIEDWTQGGTPYGVSAVQGSTAVRLTPVTGTNDANGFSTFAAYETYNDFSSPRLTNWIKPQSAPQASGAPSIGYAVSLYNGDPFSGGVLISTAAGQGGSPAEVGWIFNADTGLLFLAEDFRSTVQNPFILGFRYVGDTLASATSGGATGLEDADGDTYVRVEQTPDDDTVRIAVGDNNNLYTPTDVLTFAAPSLKINALNSNDVNTDGASISIRGGEANPFGAAFTSGGFVDVAGGGGTGNKTGGEVSIRGGSNGGAVSISAGSGNFATDTDGGDLTLFGGSGNNNGAAGDIRMTPGAAGATNAGGNGDIIFGPIGGNIPIATVWESNAGNGVGFIAPAGLTSSTTYTLPSTDGAAGQQLTTDGAGTLTWGAPGVTSAILSDADSDTTITVENTPDEDAVRFNLGDNSGNYTGTTNALAYSTTLGFRVVAPSGGVSGTTGSPIRIEAGSATDANPGQMLFFGGTGGGTANGGEISMAAGSATGTGNGGTVSIVGGNSTTSSGDGGGLFLLSGIGDAGGVIDITAGVSQGSGPGGAINLTSGNGSSTSAGGAFNMIAGNGTTGGNFGATAGNATSGSNGFGGFFFLNGGDGDGTGGGGSINLTPGRGGATGTDGGVLLVPPLLGPSGRTAELQFLEASNGSFPLAAVGFKAPTTIPANVIWTLPDADGSANQVLSTDGAGILSWQSVGATSTTEIVDADGDTFVRVEDTPDNDRILMHVGDNTGDFTLPPFTVIMGTDDISFQGSTAAPGSGADPAPIRFITGDGDDGTAGGPIIFRAGNSLGGGNGDGGQIVFEPGLPDGTGDIGHVVLRRAGPAVGETGQFRFEDLSGGEYVGFKSPDAVTATTMWTLPVADGTANQVLTTDGSGVLSWSTASGTTTELIDADGDTSVEVERTADNDTVHVRSAGTDVIVATDTTTTILNTANNYQMSVTDTNLGNLSGVEGAAFVAVDGNANFMNGVGISGGNTFSGMSRVDTVAGISSFITITDAGNFQAGVTNSGVNRFFEIDASTSDFVFRTNTGNLITVNETGTQGFTNFQTGSTAAGETHEVRFSELSTNGSNHVGFKAPDAIAADVVWTLPDADGVANQVLTTNGAGVTSWETPTNATSLSDTDGDTYVRVEENPDEDIVRMGAGDNTGIRDGDNLINLSAAVTNISTGLAQTGNTPGGTLILQTRDGSGALGSGNIVGFTGNSANNSGRINLRTGSSSGGSSGPFSFGTGNGQTASGSVGLQTGAAFNGQSGVAFMGTGGSQTAQSGQIIIQPGLSIATGQDTFITGGDVSSVSGGATHDGGNVIIAGGDVLSVVGSDRKGGDVVLRGGTGANLDTDAGDILIEGGAAFLTGDGGSVNIRATAGTVDGSINIKAITEVAGSTGVTSPLRFEESDNTGGTLSAVGFRAPTQIAADVIWTLPNADGVANQFLMTDGAGNLTWATSGSTNIYNSDGVLSANRNFDLANFDLSIEGTGGTFQMETDNGVNISTFSVDPTELLFANDSTEFTINATGYDFNFQPTGDFRLNANPGSSGEVLTSQGAGQPPVWAPATATATLDVYEVYASAAQVITAATPMGYDTERFANANYSVSGGTVTVNQSGTYEVTMCSTFDSTNGVASTPTTELVTGSGPVVGSQAYGLSLNVPNGEITATKTVLVQITGPDTFELRVTNTSGSGLTTIANQSNMIIKKVG